MSRSWLILLLAGCHPAKTEDTATGDAGMGPSPAEVEVRLAARALELARCPGSGFVPDVSGVYAALIETASEVSGHLSGAQTEILTRYAIIQLCQDEDRVVGEILLCAFDQSPLVDPAGTCAADLPGDALVANLPPAVVTGSVDIGNETVFLSGFDEVWGLQPGADLPAEPSGAGVVESDALLDQDEDGAPGVTVRGNGLTPTQAWIARRTTATFSLGIGRGGLAGTTQSEVGQTVLGGPAARALRGRRYTASGAETLWLRADGLEGSPRLDANGDGLLRCAELGAWVGTALPAPRAWVCQP